MLRRQIKQGRKIGGVSSEDWQWEGRSLKSGGQGRHHGGGDVKAKT